MMITADRETQQVQEPQSQTTVPVTSKVATDLVIRLPLHSLCRLATS